MKDDLKLKCLCSETVLELHIGFDGCDWNCVNGEGSGYDYTVDLVCPKCGRGYPIMKVKDLKNISEMVEKMRPYHEDGHYDMGNK